MGTVGNAGNWVIVCGSCALEWKRSGPLTDYEQLAMESRPCPVCGSYTLCCQPTPPQTPRRQRPREYRYAT